MIWTVNDARNQALVLPLTDEDHAIARQLAARQPTAQKATQVRLNVLAVSAVNTYLQMMEISTDLAASESRSPFLSLCGDVADLVVTNIGQLECRPVVTNAQTCHIPAEVWDDRIGYVAVQIDEALEEAALVGFIPTVEAEAVPLHQFQPLGALLRRLHNLRGSEVPPARESSVRLSQWVQGVFETGWQTVEELLGEPQIRFAAAFRRGDRPERGKLIHLTTPQGERLVILIVNQALAIESEGEPNSDPQNVEIELKVISADQQSLLPAGLQLTLLDESGSVLRETEARSEDDYLRLEVDGHSDERFSVRVMLAGSSMTEHFVI